MTIAIPVMPDSVITALAGPGALIREQARDAVRSVMYRKLYRRAQVLSRAGYGDGSHARGMLVILAHAFPELNITTADWEDSARAAFQRLPTPAQWDASLLDQLNTARLLSMSEHELPGGAFADTSVITDVPVPVLVPGPGHAYCPECDHYFHREDDVCLGHDGCACPCRDYIDDDDDDEDEDY
jgi:hypothetical protein